MEELIGLIVQIVIPLLMLAGAYITGTMAERRHYRSIEDRERSLIHIPAVTAKDAEVDESRIVKAEMVLGSVVISNDYFKRFLALLRNIFGGRVKSYESLVDRARREAVLRMKEMAGDATLIVNVRLETSTIGSSRRKKGAVGCVEALAYGTALTLRP